ncbi:MAG: NAD(P)/FAD-dependent oxidoreductase, partial [Kangiellaceae bacterium]|nr:NAD(P)/FAD-dependent oxidoreductase [Kangiellaceae bacterium]
MHTESLDVLIVGAGISGLGLCYSLKNKRPNDKIAVIEARDNYGGTWDLFKYPGIRSDSDMYTFAYSFKPWKERDYIGSAENIRKYLDELVDDEGLEPFIRLQQKVIDANWDSARNHWDVTVKRGDGTEYLIEAKFFACCAGYYRYDKGYLPSFEGYENFKGEIALPQSWPEDLDYSNKQVLVIGSGATAVTVVPAMAESAAKVTMLQRSPTYIFSRPSSDWLYRILSKILPDKLTNSIMRFKYATLQQAMFVLSKQFPNVVKGLLRFANKRALDGAADVDVHFNPSYAPWDQRMCLVPNNDLFDSIKSGKTEVVTDHIKQFTESGVELESGKTIDADIVVPATGLELQLWGSINLTVDGLPVQGVSLTNYKGMMFSQLPNFIWVFGYTNASWTLKAELTYNYIVKLLDYMEKHNHQSVYPYRNPDAEQETIVALKSGYIMRALHFLPSQGSQFPWCNKDLYYKDLFAIRYSKLNDGVLRFDDNSELKPFHQKANSEFSSEKISQENDEKIVETALSWLESKCLTNK